MTTRIETIGDATLYLGDCRDILPTLPKVDCLITDPPYGIGVKLGVSSGGSNGGMWKNVTIFGDEDVSVRDDVLRIVGELKSMAIFASHKAPPPAGYEKLLIWDKGAHTGAGNLSFPWKPCFEFVWLAGQWNGPRVSGVIRFLAVAGCVGAANDGIRNHPTEKPVDLMEHFVQRMTGNSCIDLFMGSGTIGVACANLGKTFIGIEREPKYFDIACKRIENAYRQERLFA